MHLRILFFLLFCLAQPFAYAQLTMGKRWAVVIGIADYEDEKITDLKYADRDAEEFVKFLQSKAGGNHSPDQIMLLTNKAATHAEIYGALDWLTEEAQPNDKVTIYFSGHGDVETKLNQKQGFLLTHNTPASNYRISALRVTDIDDYLQSLIQNNQAKVTIITDACRSGSLAGGAGGVQAAAAAMSAQFDNAIKIMSCQANELSQEGDWGGGRGVFSYHLLDGLKGLADNNGDLKVSLMEIRRYLEEKVSEATDGEQIPFVQGALNTGISYVDEEDLEKLIAERALEEASLGAVASKGSAASFLEAADTSVQKMYEEFLAAIEDQYFLPAEINNSRKQGKSADELYQILMVDRTLKPLHGTIKRNYVVALQEKAQQSLNAYLKADSRELAERWNTYGVDYRGNLPLLRRAAEILGEKHRLYQQLKSKEYYFEGVILRLEGEKSEDTKLFEQALEKEYLALALDSQAAYIYNELGLIYGRLDDKKKEISNYEKAMELAPTWIMPINNLSHTAIMQGDYQKAIALANKALELDRNAAPIYHKLALGNWGMNNLDRADSLFRQSILIDSTYFFSILDLGILQYQQENYAEAEQLYKKAVEINKHDAQIYMNLGILYLVTKRYEAAEMQFREVLNNNPKNKWAHYNIACVKALQNDENETFIWLEKTLELGFDEFEHLENDPEFNNIRKLPKYQALMSKYNQNKDSEK